MMDLFYFYMNNHNNNIMSVVGLCPTFNGCCISVHLGLHVNVMTNICHTVLSLLVLVPVKLKCNTTTLPRSDTYPSLLYMETHVVYSSQFTLVVPNEINFTALYFVTLEINSQMDFYLVPILDPLRVVFYSCIKQQRL